MQKAIPTVQTASAGMQPSMCGGNEQKERGGKVEKEKGETEGGAEDPDRLEERPGKGGEWNSSHTGQWEKLHFVYWEG